MDPITEQAAADRQVAEAVAAEYESLSLGCRADPARFERLLAPDFHDFGPQGAVSVTLSVKLPLAPLKPSTKT